MSQDALDLWQEKLDFFEKELALASGPEKFTLTKRIQEARSKIDELQARSSSPRHPIASPVAESSPARTTPTKRHVFLSYVDKNFDEVSALRQDLIVLGEEVSWDQDVPVGGNERREIREALKHAYACVLCLSKAMEERASSSAYRQIQDAIGIYRELAPGGIFIIPARLDDCEVPSFEIDSTTMLEDLRFVDLFPLSRRVDGLQRLIAALRLCPGHP